MCKPERPERRSQIALSLRQLGLERASVVEVLREGPDTCVCRVKHEDTSYVLKWFASDGPVAEVRAYGLLQEYDVPTLRVHARTESALLLEDLAASPHWRVAAEEDASDPSTGRAVALWYRELHRAGRELLGRPEPPPDFLGRESDTLSVAGILSIGRKFDMADNPVWDLAAEHIEAIKAAMRSLPETLNYNDFHWTNLALSRQPPLRAVVFDYHLLGIGPAYSDYRNVLGSLRAGASAAFRQAYGPVDEREAILDASVSVLCALQVAAERAQLPAWAEGVIERVRRGDLQEALLRAISTL